MVEPAARIRPFKPTDDKQVRFAIGKANLGCLAVANRRAYVHPVTVSLWIGLSCILVQVMQWWPNPAHGILRYLSPIPAFASMAVPIMFLIDWLNRPFFEKLTQDALRQQDLADITSYYARSPASGFWILEYGSKFVGLLALDASLESPSTNDKSENKPKKGTSRTATIRHFYVEEPYQPTGIQVDLLEHAIRHAFTTTKELQTIKAADSPLVPYVRDAYRERGFELQKYTEKVGVFGWKLGERLLERDVWTKKE